MMVEEIMFRMALKLRPNQSRESLMKRYSCKLKNKGQNHFFRGISVQLVLEESEVRY